jgi:hypothetical protein
MPIPVKNGLTFRSLTSDPASPANGDLWYRSDLDLISYRSGGVTYRCAPATVSGTGTPEGSVTAGIGKLFLSTDKGRAFIKQSGAGNTGWSSISDAWGNISLPTGVFIYVPMNTVSTSIFAANGETRYTAVYFPHACTISDIGIEVSTVGAAGSVARIGIYAMNTSLKPGTLILDAGTVTTAAGTIQTIASLSGVIPSAGWYFFSVSQQGAPATRHTLRTISNIGAVPPVSTGSGTAAANTGAFTAYTSTGITGALASTPTVTPGNTDPIKVQYKLSSVP